MVFLTELGHCAGNAVFSGSVGPDGSGEDMPCPGQGGRQSQRPHRTCPHAGQAVHTMYEISVPGGVLSNRYQLRRA